MKQIFEWMRKQPLKAFKVYDGSIGVEPSEVNRLIDEAEAKCSDIEQDAYERGYVLGFDNGYKDGKRFEKAKWESEHSCDGCVRKDTEHYICKDCARKYHADYYETEEYIAMVNAEEEAKWSNEN